jgi:acetyltransferase-like isoleucine patch superfamily enzyme
MNPRALGQLAGLDPYATWRLGRRAGQATGVLCFGKVQLTLARSAKVTLVEGRSRIGEAIQGALTPRNARTVLNLEGELALDRARIGRGAMIQVARGARLAIGCGSYINDGCRVIARSRIEIGKGCAIAWGVTILDDDGHGFGPPPYSRPITIEDRVWVGGHAQILKGVTIGEGSVVAAGAVVTRSCPPRSLVAGVPARVVRTGVSWTDEARAGAHFSV